jgi:hypothetical protein
MKYAIAILLLTGCATWKEISCYDRDGKPRYHAEVRQIDRQHFIQHDGELHTDSGLCVHDHPGFWNRTTGGIFDSLERGQ